MPTDFKIRLKILRTLQLRHANCGPACLQMIICRHNKLLITQSQLEKELSTLNNIEFEKNLDNTISMKKTGGTFPGILAIVLSKYTNLLYKPYPLKQYFGKHDNLKDIENFTYNVYQSLINNMPVIIAINGHTQGQIKDIAHYVVIYSIEGSLNDINNIKYGYCDPADAQLKHFQNKHLVTFFSKGQGFYIGRQWQNKSLLNQITEEIQEPIEIN